MQAIGLLCGGVLADLMYRRTKAARQWLMVASLLLCAPCLHAPDPHSLHPV
jgi:hypothetical protein